VVKASGGYIRHVKLGRDGRSHREGSLSLGLYFREDLVGTGGALSSGRDLGPAWTALTLLAEVVFLADDLLVAAAASEVEGADGYVSHLGLMRALGGMPIQNPYGPLAASHSSVISGASVDTAAVRRTAADIRKLWGRMLDALDDVEPLPGDGSTGESVV
jgi:hypothetical protein